MSLLTSLLPLVARDFSSQVALGLHPALLAHGANLEPTPFFGGAPPQALLIVSGLTCLHSPLSGFSSSCMTSLLACSSYWPSPGHWFFLPPKLDS